MKTRLFAGCGIIFLVVFPILGQGFVDLNFEAAHVAPLYTNVNVYIDAASALPGWLALSGTNQLSTIPYKPSGAIGFFVALYGSNSSVINGNFDVQLTSSISSISQTGLVPTNAESLLFEMAPSGSGLSLSLGGQDLSFVAISNLVNSAGYHYTLYGTDISSFAGQVATLRFYGTPGGGAFLDDIQFSPVPVPEPVGLGWLAFGSGILLYVIRRRHR